MEAHVCGPAGVGKTLATTDDALIRTLQHAVDEWGMEGVWLTVTRMRFGQEITGVQIVYEAGRCHGYIMRNAELMEQAKHIPVQCSAMHPQQDVNHPGGHTAAELLKPKV